MRKNLFCLDKERDGQLEPLVASLRLATKKERRVHLLGYMIRQIAEDAKMSEEVRMEALEMAVPHKTIQAVVQDHRLEWQRDRKLSAEMGLLLGLAMHVIAFFNDGRNKYR